MEAIKKERQHETILKSPPAYDPQGNGAIESGVKQLKGMLRTLTLVLEDRMLLASESVVNIIGKKCSVVFVEECSEHLQTRETWGIRHNGLSRTFEFASRGYCFGEAERLT